MGSEDSSLIQILIKQGEENNRTNKDLADSIRDLTSKVEKSLDKHELTDKEIESFHDFKEYAKPIIEQAKKTRNLWMG